MNTVLNACNAEQNKVDKSMNTQLFRTQCFTPSVCNDDHQRLIPNTKKTLDIYNTVASRVQ